ncbi:hypothetical protein K469DRAFT_554562 [Zopfia rhizophila CBS 207.26]|uniref:TPR-like protein n=1 Tax=Zopfia rhizophila CBS 207.26 TaxID=1314779 RepID=A0A6A6EPZ2_9PEZI|nr:hypothetical protein K469DRAFT_554562 [Zopfia rhizophila CBS 207.26]
MPPKRKDFLKPNPKAKAKPQDPQTENDFLETADEFEQAAGKWRAGDAAKATRFFNRAIDTYNDGLQRYPSSFDLAYNKANLEYNMSEDDRIVALLGNKIDLLEETLRSHRAAIALKPEDTDVLFNTGQVLASLADTLLESGSQEATKAPTRSMLEEAVDIFTKCLASQQQEHKEMQIELEKAKADGDYQEPLTAGGASQDTMETSPTSSEPPGEWATVVEPVTPETILETCTAQLGALTTLIGLYDPSDSTKLDPAVERGLGIVKSEIPLYINFLQASPVPNIIQEPAPGPTLFISSSSTAEEAKASPKDDALLTAANFQVSVAEVGYRGNRVNTTTYISEIEQVFAPLIRASETNTTDLSTINARSAYADALIDFASAIADNPKYTSTSPTFPADLESQWNALTLAQTILTQLSTHTTILSPSRLADIFLARGDTELFRFRISLFENSKPAWTKSKTVLVSNAGVFYRGARSYSERTGAVEVQKTADAKAIVAEILKEAAGGVGQRKEHWMGRRQDVVRVLEQLVEEGIVGRENVEGVVGFTE